MATLLSKTATGQKPVTSLMSALVMGIMYEYVTTTALAAGDIIDLGPIEAGVVPVDVKLITDDLDTNGTPLVTLSVGILNAGKTDLSGGTNETFITASTIGQTGGVAPATTAAVYLLGASTSARRLGIKVVAAPATNAAVGKKIAVVLSATE
jgi:hypothetical protein